MSEQIRDGIPEALDELARDDDMIHAFVSSLRAGHRRWDSTTAIELIRYMATRNAVQRKQLVRLISLSPAPVLFKLP